MEKQIYLVDYITKQPGENRYNGNVARNDVVKTFLSIGANYIQWHPKCSKNIPVIGKILRVLTDLGQAIPLLTKLRKNDEVYLQYPFFGKGTPIVLNLIKNLGANTTVLIHDLDFIRFPELAKYKSRQIHRLNSANRLLVHTPQMADKLKHMCITTKMEPIELFDYYAIDSYRPFKDIVTDKYIIAFAGNLTKSIFLRELDKSTIPNNFTYRFYGVEPKEAYKNDRIEYQGKFSPEHTGTIHAGWGLVWDGNSIDTCSGILGDYLRMIAPHKLSLYIASGIPVIVWSQSAHANFVRENNLGIAVDRLSDIYRKIEAISVDQYKQMIHNIQKLGNQLREGEFLKKHIYIK